MSVGDIICFVRPCCVFALSPSTAKTKKISAKINAVGFWKGAKYGKQGTGQKQGKEKEEARKAKTAEEVNCNIHPSDQNDLGDVLLNRILLMRKV